MTYSKIETLLEIILGNNNLEELKKNTSELIFLVDKMFIEFTGNSFFCTFLISKILNPLTDKILEINPENYNSRSRIKLKNTIAEKKKILTDLRNKIINTYKNHLIDSDVYKDYISEKINKIEAAKLAILFYLTGKWNQPNTFGTFLFQNLLECQKRTDI
jgi:hypothetical protein